MTSNTLLLSDFHKKMTLNDFGIKVSAIACYFVLKFS